MDAQMDRVLKMSEQFAIPIPNLESPFAFPPSLMPPPAGNTLTTTTTKATMPQENSGNFFIDRPKVFSAPPAPHMPTAVPVSGLWQPQSSPPTALTNPSGPFPRAPKSPHPSPLDRQPKPVSPVEVASKHPQLSSIAPKKEDMAYKTTPCRHFTVNRGWCPWGDECGL